MSDYEYKELETEEDIGEGYEAQTNLEEKMLYVLNYMVRDYLIEK